MTFSKPLQEKIDRIKTTFHSQQIGSLTFASPLLLAPLASITNLPFRRLMSNLGAGGTVSELISCHGINYKNDKTLKMLEIHEEEGTTGIQLFGENADALAESVKIVLDFNPDFIDLNMGCPVRKVVKKGAGSAMMKTPEKLSEVFSKLRKASTVPVTIKIRTGWDEDHLNAPEVIHIAKEEGIDFVTIHGRTQTQAYRGRPNWEYIEEVAKNSPLPLIGNGDLHSPDLVKTKLANTNCQGLMLGRGALRNPFIFLESFSDEEFHAEDYLEVALKFSDYLHEYTERERILLIQLKKHIMWMAQGYPSTTKFRKALFASKTVDELLEKTKEYFGNLGTASKEINYDDDFLTGGHG